MLSVRVHAAFGFFGGFIRMEALNHLRPLKPLGSEEKRSIRKAYQALLKDLGASHELYVQQTVARTIRGLISQPGSFRYRIGIVASCLLDLYIDSGMRAEPSISISDSGRARILAALHYLCDPMDLIPDYTPGRGFSDDAYVLELCIRGLKKTDRGILDAFARRISERLSEG